MLAQSQVDAYRNKTFRFLYHYHLRFKHDAIRYVNERGFIFFWPVKKVLLPSLWGATVGDRPVPDNHDDPGHITWRWKDDLLGKRKWYYARVLCKRNTLLSLKALPNFYALSPNYGDPENDYLLQYKQGLLPREAKLIYETLLREGQMNTIALKKAVRLSAPSDESHFNRALEILQADFRILPVGIAEAGSWKYAFVYDTVHHHMPDLMNAARMISVTDARQYLLETYLKTIGACPLNVPSRLFKWGEGEMKSTLHELVKKKRLFKLHTNNGDQSEWVIHPDFYEFI